MNVNKKEFNYCLRHHTDTTLKMFGFYEIHVPPKTYVRKLNTDPNSMPEYIERCYTCYDGYAGECPNCREAKLELHQWLSAKYMGG